MVLKMAVFGQVLEMIDPRRNTTISHITMVGKNVNSLSFCGFKRRYKSYFVFLLDCKRLPVSLSLLSQNHINMLFQFCI